MDIYSWAEENNADYLDLRTGLIYKVQEYNKIKKIDPDAVIEVRDMNGYHAGHAVKR